METQFRRDTDVVLEGLTAENRCYRMTLDEAGRIVSLFDKRENREVFKGLGNEIQVFEDIPRLYDNWNLSEYYKSKQWTLDSPACITPVTDGSRAGFRVERTYLNSRMVQHIWLYSESPRIDFEHDIDWHEHHQLVKAAFPLDIICIYKITAYPECAALNSDDLAVYNKLAALFNNKLTA